jgi:hypothetical protein
LERVREFTWEIAARRLSVLFEEVLAERRSYPVTAPAARQPSGLLMGGSKV